MNEKLQKEYQEYQKDFSEKDVDKVLDNEENLTQKFKKKKSLQHFWSDFKLVYSMLRDYKNKTYRQVPWNSIVAIGGALLYVLSPIDLIPDFIIGLGLIDDTAVFSFMLKMVTKDIEKYKFWLENQKI